MRRTRKKHMHVNEESDLVCQDVIERCRASLYRAVNRNKKIIQKKGKRHGTRH